MTLRKRCLSAGWYPSHEKQVRGFLDKASQGVSKKTGRAGIAPHGGWYYSGGIAARLVAALDPTADTVAVIGGHLPAGAPPLFVDEDAVETPLGTIEIDQKLRSLLKKELIAPTFPQGTGSDRHRDNTVETLLPMVAYFFPQARLLALRLPAEPASSDAGKILAESAVSLNRALVVIGSTDLTHYGGVYDFTPHGQGRQALDWVKNVHDRAFIDAVLEGDPDTILARAADGRSACSAGAVLGALGFARARGANTGELLDYSTSAEAEDFGYDDVPDSFVGYAGIVWS
jgi:AmmeMemoRadiSam system protein B